MKPEWYYVENDETVGPSTLDDVARRIKRLGSTCLVWKAGMAEWTEAREVPALARFVQSSTPQAATATFDLAESSDSKQASLSQRLRHELIEYAIISAYLYVCFSSIIFYKATILRSDGIVLATFGIAIVKALVLGKFILILHALRIGERRGGAGVLFVDILKNSILFVICLIALTVVEEMIVGLFHGQTSQEVLSEMAGGSLLEAFAVSILMLLTLIPYFTFRGVSERLGKGALKKLLTEPNQSL